MMQLIAQIHTYALITPKGYMLMHHVELNDKCFLKQKDDNFEGELKNFFQEISGLDFGEGVKFVPTKLLLRFQREHKEFNNLSFGDLLVDPQQVLMVTVAAALRAIGYEIEVDVDLVSSIPLTTDIFVPCLSVESMLGKRLMISLTTAAEILASAKYMAKRGRGERGPASFQKKMTEAEFYVEFDEDMLAMGKQKSKLASWLGLQLRTKFSYHIPTNEFDKQDWEKLWSDAKVQWKILDDGPKDVFIRKAKKNSTDWRNMAKRGRGERGPAFFQKKMTEAEFYVEFDEDMLAMGKQKSKLASWLGLQLRTKFSYHIPTNEFDKQDWEKLWSDAKVQWKILDDGPKDVFIRKAKKNSTDRRNMAKRGRGERGPASFQKKMTEAEFYVEFDEDMLAMGKQKSKLASWLGLQLRTKFSYHIPTNEFDKQDWEKLWSDAKVQWKILDDGPKDVFIRKAKKNSTDWRNMAKRGRGERGPASFQKKMTEAEFYVEFDEDMLAMGKQKSKLASWLGLQLRTKFSYHIPTNEFDKQDWEKLWSDAKVQWKILDDGPKDVFIRKAKKNSTDWRMYD
ncbi:hypothetical protein L1987_43426 [Smallanthus sonchifolius]|uniref:Uncharacterized protein n=1 Tax=Smallanthus sonchifolius TaxID=185202 RepID=A0ACB9GLD0_9ASTR|nr:hypothetical protein L1987_43426 [Smallanthus sonchifolius]